MRKKQKIYTAEFKAEAIKTIDLNKGKINRVTVIGKDYFIGYGE